MTFAGDFEFRSPFIVNPRINGFVFHLDTQGVGNIRLNLSITLETFRFLECRTQLLLLCLAESRDAAGGIPAFEELFETVSLIEG